MYGLDQSTNNFETDTFLPVSGKLKRVKKGKTPKPHYKGKLPKFSRKNFVPYTANYKGQHFEVNNFEDHFSLKKTFKKATGAVKKVASKAGGAVKKAAKFTAKKAVGLKTDAKNVGKATVKAGKFVAKTAKKLVGNLLFAPLIPFRPAMTKQLNKKGVSTKKMTIDDVTRSFYNNVVAKKNNLEDFDTVMENFEYLENHISGEAIMGVAGGVGNIISAVLDYFKGAKQKAASGTATPEEKQLAQDVVSGEKSIQAADDYKEVKLAAQVGEIIIPGFSDKVANTANKVTKVSKGVSKSAKAAKLAVKSREDGTPLNEVYESEQPSNKWLKMLPLALIGVIVLIFILRRKK